NYVQWSIDNNYSKHKINPIRRRLEFFYSLVDKKKLYLSFEEKEGILLSLKNATDQAFVQLLFEGVAGNKLSEISNLKYEDCIVKDGRYYLNLHDNKNNGEVVSRTLEVSRKTYFLCMSAHREKEYYKRNGDMDING